jgi:hypothetical protein
MSCAAAGTDVFHAVADPHRRQILDVLRGGRIDALADVIRRTASNG